MARPKTCPIKRVSMVSPLLAYLLIAFGIAWAGWVPVAVLSNSGAGLRLENPLVALSPFAFGPTAAGIIVTWMTDGREGLRKLLARAVAWRVGARWYVVVIFLPLVTFLLAGFLRSAVGGIPLDFSQSEVRLQYPSVNSLAILPLALLTGILWGPVSEEIGWRGFALPHLQKRLSPFGSSIVLGIIWGLWHLPLFFIPGMVQAELPVIPFMVSVLANTFLYTWVHNNTCGSILMAIIMHDTFNTFSAYVPIRPTDPYAIAMTATIAGVVVLGGRKGWFRKAKQS